MECIFLVYLVAIFIGSTAETANYSLVSSLNVSDGIGTTAFAVGYATSLLAATVTPVVGYRYGVKTLLLIAVVSYFMFILGNIYTSYYTTVPSGFFLGLAEAFGWTATPILTANFAKRNPNKKGDLEKYHSYYNGYFFTAYQASAVAGSVLTYVILHIDRSLSPVGKNVTFVPTNASTSLRYMTADVCGANDCQLAEVTFANMEQYEPRFAATRYIMVAILCFLMACAFALHLFFLPNDIAWELEGQQKNESKDFIELESLKFDEENSTQKIVENGGIKVSCKSEMAKYQISSWFLVKHFLTSTLSLAFTPKHLLVVLLPIYNGMTISYTFGEMTRAYSTCILGIDKVGVSVTLYSLTNALFSMIAGKMGGKFGRNIPFMLAFVIDISNYTFSLLWQIDDDNTWLVYLLFTSFGSSDGIWQSLITAMYGEYFGANEKIAYNLWNVVVNFGMLIQFSVSKLMCVRVKIYIQIALLSVAMLTYGISQIVYYRPKLSKKKEDQ